MTNILKKLRTIICGTIRGVFKFIYRLWKYLATWQAHRDTIKHLNRMSNAQLRDIGITRGEINNMVWMKKDMLDSGDRTND